jgi:hypothetical protein
MASTFSMRCIKHAIEGEQHVVGVEVAARRKGFAGVKLDPFTQVEGIGQAVLGDIPTSCQRRFCSGATFFELGEAVVQWFGGIVVGTAGELRDIEAGRAAFRAEHQSAAGMGRGCLGREAQQRRKDKIVTHGDPFFQRSTEPCSNPWWRIERRGFGASGHADPAYGFSMGRPAR